MTMFISASVIIVFVFGFNMVYNMKSSMTLPIKEYGDALRNHTKTLCKVFLKGEKAQNLSRVFESRKEADLNGDNIIQFNESLNYAKKYMDEVDEEFEHVWFNLFDVYSQEGEEYTLDDNLDTFIKVDKNEDGMITMKECLAFHNYIIRKTQEHLNNSVTL